MAVFRGGIIVATGAGNAAVHAGPNPSGLWLTSLSPGFVANPGLTSITPPPTTGTAPGGAGTSGQGGVGSCSPGGGSICSGGNCGS